MCATVQNMEDSQFHGPIPSYFRQFSLFENESTDPQGSIHVFHLVMTYNTTLFPSCPISQNPSRFKLYISLNLNLLTLRF